MLQFDRAPVQPAQHGAAQVGLQPVHPLGVRVDRPQGVAEPGAQGGEPVLLAVDPAAQGAAGPVAQAGTAASSATAGSDGGFPKTLLRIDRSRPTPTITWADTAERVAS